MLPFCNLVVRLLIFGDIVWNKIVSCQFTAINSFDYDTMSFQNKWEWVDELSLLTCTLCDYNDIFFTKFVDIGVCLVLILKTTGPSYQKSEASHLHVYFHLLTDFIPMVWTNYLDQYGWFYLTVQKSIWKFVFWVLFP